MDGRLTKSRREGARMRGLSLPPPTGTHTHARTSPMSRARKDARGMLGSSMDQQDPHPHGDVSRAGVARTVGERQGNVRGVGVLYQTGARGGELSSSKRSVSVT